MLAGTSSWQRHGAAAALQSLKFPGMRPRHACITRANTIASTHPRATRWRPGPGGLWAHPAAAGQGPASKQRMV